MKPRSCGARSARLSQLSLCSSRAILTSVCYRLRRGWKGCVECDNMLDTHCKWLYGLFFRLEDDEGGHIIVSVSGKEVRFLAPCNTRL